MKKILLYLTFLISLFIYTGCGEKFLDTAYPTTILSDQQVWKDENAIINLLANLYNRLPVASGGGATIASNWSNWSAFDEAIATGTADLNTGNNSLSSYATNRWTLWTYDVNRDINLALDGIDQYSTLTDAKKTLYKAQLRFLRAYNMFEIVKRMGGVPIITTQLIYDYSGNATSLRRPRNTEAECYDFIATELDAVKGDLGYAGSKDWANRYSAEALKCRAMLYAGSKAKYNALLTPQIVTAGGEVGIPAARAAGYYQAALDAAKVIIASGQYGLYDKNPDLGENFYEALTKKTGNNEMIMVQDFNISKNKKHNFSYQNICRTMREDNLSSSSLCPTLNLVEAFEYLDGTDGALKGVGTGSNTAAGQTSWIFYNKLSDIFANKDARLYGTVVYPGTVFKGVDVNMQAGVYVWNATAGKYDRTETSTLGGLFTTGTGADGKLLTGLGGPTRSVDETSNTGFYMKKFIDPATLSSARGVGSDIAWPRFRYGEVLLNAAEAAFELGGAANLNDAVTYINLVRKRAGFGANSLNTTTLTFAKIVNERRVELAFEDHRVYDLNRWRTAHTVWNGSTSSTTSMMYALFPYRIIRPGHPNDGKYVFDKIAAPKFVSARFFQISNYYSAVDQNVLDNNPLIIKNPFH